MGFFEDDRIRSKNAIHNAAHSMYSSLKNSGYSNEDIVTYLSNYTGIPVCDEVRKLTLEIAKGVTDAEISASKDGLASANTIK